MNTSFPDRWSFSYPHLTKICDSHNRWTKVLIRTVWTSNSKEPQQKYRLGTVSIKILGGINRFYGIPNSGYWAEKKFWQNYRSSRAISLLLFHENWRVAVPKSVHALDESCFMHVTETKYATSLTILSLLATLSQRTLETVGRVKNVWRFVQ